MKKHITQAAIDKLAKDYNEAHRNMRTHKLNGDAIDSDLEYNIMIAYASAFAVLTDQEYDVARMMLRKRAGII